MPRLSKELKANWTLPKQTNKQTNNPPASWPNHNLENEKTTLEENICRSHI